MSRQTCEIIRARHSHRLVLCDGTYASIGRLWHIVLCDGTYASIVL